MALLREADPGLQLGSVRLDKHLPVAAGLGGGSADAAALLRAVRRANAGRAAGVPWLEIAARLGADVPVCLPAGRLHLGQGRDTSLRSACLPRLARCSSIRACRWQTARVFAALRRGSGSHAAPTTDPRPSCATSSDLLAYMRTHGNDLERPATALLPVIGEIKSALEARPGCRLAAMSGSGPTCFGIFADPAEAGAPPQAIAAAHGDWWVKSAIARGC